MAMQQQHLFPQEQPFLDRFNIQVQPKAVSAVRSVPRQASIGLLLVAALLAFEVFNFDTTRFALANLLGDVNFAGLRWASILALAFCAIDFAGLAHLFGPGRDPQRSTESWYLMGAWLLGATMNALMTWWAVNLTLLNHQLGNEVMSREQLINIVPTFVAVLVWLTRILFIGAFSVAGDRLFLNSGDEASVPESRASNFAGESARPVRQEWSPSRRPLRDLDAHMPMRRRADLRSIPSAPDPTSMPASGDRLSQRRRA
jgi:hypothetical protein